MITQRAFYVMVGISGSGKSTRANEIKEQIISNFPEEDSLGKANIVDIFSSDELRLELLGDYNDQTQNQRIFNTLRDRARNAIKKYHNIIIDTTALTIKDRRSIIDYFKNVEAEYRRNYHVIAYVMSTPFSICQKQNTERTKSVPDYVLHKQLHKFEIPFIEEGFDDIMIDTYEDFNGGKISSSETKISTIMSLMSDFDQRNSHHVYDLATHCVLTSAYINQYFFDNNKSFNDSMNTAALIHDIGKIYTGRPKSDNSGEYCYHNHANVGAYTLLQNLDYIYRHTKKETLDVLFYVNYHMFPFSWQNESTHEKYRKIFGEEKYNNLILFNKYDQLASGT